MNIQLCRPAVTDPHKVRPCNYTGLLPYHIRTLLKYSELHLEYFWRTSCYMYPPQNGQYCPAFPIFFLYLPPKIDRLVWLKYAFPCHPIYRVCIRYGTIARICSDSPRDV